jgi:hypothetical protein
MNKIKYRINISKRVADHLINAILIFASVFLAFWMNDIRTERNKIELTKDAKRAILVQFKLNRIILERWAPYHEDILKRGAEEFLKNIDTVSRFDLELIPGLNNGIQNEILMSNGWVLVDDQQINFDIETRLLTNQIYEQQRLVTEATRKITDDFLTQIELFDETKAKANYLMFYSLLDRLWEQENAMIIRLKEAINALEN